MARARRCRGLGQAAGLAAAGCLGAAAVLLNTCNFVQVPGLHAARQQHGALRRIAFFHRTATAEEQEEVDEAVEEDVEEKLLVSELEVGQEVDGVVVNRLNSVGFFIDIGAEKHGLLEFDELVDGFTTKNDYLRKADFVTAARVLEIDGRNFYLTRRTGELARPPRFRQKLSPEDVEAFEGVPSDTWLQGEVAGMWAKGVWVKIAPPSGGKPIGGLLKREDFTDGLENEIVRGMKVMVRVTGVDAPQKRVDVSMRDP